MFESQNKLLTSSELGDRTIVKDVRISFLSLDHASLLGYGISQSRCQWKLNFTADEHALMIARAIRMWGPSEGKITRIYLSASCLTSDGVSHLLSLPDHILSDLSELVVYGMLDIKPCHTLADYIPCLPNLRVLILRGYAIGCEGAELLSLYLKTNTTLRVLGLSKTSIKNRGGCCLAKALTMNTGLKVLHLTHNPLGKGAIQKLIGSLQRNCTLELIYLPKAWEELARHCNGYEQTTCIFRF